VVNIEQQNKEPQNEEVITSIFPPEADSIFCSSERRYLRRSQFWLFFSWILPVPLIGVAKKRGIPAPVYWMLDPLPCQSFYYTEIYLKKNNFLLEGRKSSELKEEVVETLETVETLEIVETVETVQVVQAVEVVN
jgi:hypothetical protein